MSNAETVDVGWQLFIATWKTWWCCGLGSHFYGVDYRQSTRDV